MNAHLKLVLIRLPPLHPCLHFTTPHPHPPFAETSFSLAPLSSLFFAARRPLSIPKRAFAAPSSCFLFLLLFPAILLISPAATDALIAHRDICLAPLLEHPSTACCSTYSRRHCLFRVTRDPTPSLHPCQFLQRSVVDRWIILISRLASPSRSLTQRWKVCFIMWECVYARECVYVRECMYARSHLFWRRQESSRVEREKRRVQSVQSIHNFIIKSEFGFGNHIN